MKRLRMILGAAAGLALACVTASAETVHYPDDGDSSLQAAADRAGCGGSVHIAPGEYNERVIFPNPAAPHIESCTGVRLLGSGVDATIIDGTGLADPFGFPVIVLGYPPFASLPFTGPDYELAHLTLRAGPETAPIGFGGGWLEGVEIHDVRITGFITGIAIGLSNNATLHDLAVIGPGELAVSQESRCVQLSTGRRFLERFTDGHQQGHQVYNADLRDCTRGIELDNAAHARIHGSVITHTQIGINPFGVEDSEIDFNFIAQANAPDGAAIDPSNLNRSSIHHNVLCKNNVGIWFRVSQTPSAFGIPPSSGNTIHHNTFSKNKDGDLRFDDRDLGPGNEASENTSDPRLHCAP